MEKIELIEKLKSKTNINAEEAKDALEKNDWDILDALVYLERNGTIGSTGIGIYNTNENNSNNDYSKSNIDSSKCSDEIKFSEKAFNFISDVSEKGNRNVLEIGKAGKKKIRMPISILVLLIIFAFWFVIPFIILGLFFDFKFALIGPDINDNIVNKFSNKASDVACKIKKDIKKG